MARSASTSADFMRTWLSQGSAVTTPSFSSQNSNILASNKDVGAPQSSPSSPPTASSHIGFEDGGDKIAIPIGSDAVEELQYYDEMNLQHYRPGQAQVNDFAGTTASLQFDYHHMIKNNIFPEDTHLLQRIQSTRSNESAGSQRDAFNWSVPSSGGSDAAPNYPLPSSPYTSSRVLRDFPAPLNITPRSYSPQSYHSVPEMAREIRPLNTLSSPSYSFADVGFDSSANSLPALSRFSSDSSGNGSSSRHKLLRKRKTLPLPSLKRLLKSSIPLIDGAKAGNYDEVLRQLEPGRQTHPISVTDKDGFTALHYACQIGHEPIVRALILRGAEIEARTKFQDRTPLFLAAQMGHVPIVTILLQKTADVNASCKLDGATALHAASQHGHEQVIRLLLNAGADVNRRDIEGMPPLMWTTQGKQLTAAQTLISAGADLEIRIKLGANLEVSSVEGLTVLQRAVNTGNYDFARLFLQMGANPNAVGPNGMRPLHKAATRGDLKMCELLIDYGAETSPRTGDGWTALHCAARYGHKIVAKILVKRGCERMVRTKRNETAAELAARYGFNDII